MIELTNVAIEADGLKGDVVLIDSSSVKYEFKHTGRLNTDNEAILNEVHIYTLPGISIDPELSEDVLPFTAISDDPRGASIAYVVKRAPVLMLSTSTCSCGKMPDASSRSRSIPIEPS